MRILSLFSGIGGLELGLKLALPAAVTVAYVEADAYCREVLRARMKDGWLDEGPIFEDIREFDGSEWRGRVDLACGGFPCQDISAAGRREGIREGNRSGLWFEFARVVREVRPRFVYAENVAALLVRGMDTVLGDLAGLGYDAEWGLFSAAEVGAPHLRRRVFILADAQCLGSERRGSAGDVESTGGEAEGEARQRERSGNAAVDSSTGVLADANGGRQRQPQRSIGDERGWTGDGCQPLADAERPEWRQDALSRGDSGEGRDGEGEATGGVGERRLFLAGADGQRGELRAAAGERPGRPAGGGSDVADGGGKRLEGDSRAGATARPVGRGSGAAMANAASDIRGAFRHGGRESPDGTGDSLFPPGPADRDGWAEYLARAPHLIPVVRRGAHGVPRRVQRLRALGNSVVPLVSAYAFCSLWARMENER